MFERIRNMEDRKIAIYCRVSTDEQAKNGYSIKDQKIVLENIILDNNWGDAHNTTYYIDDGYSGTSMQRPRFQALLNDIKGGRINLVVCTSQDRIGRENEYNSFWIKYLLTFGVELYVKDMPGLDIYTDTGVLNYHITSAFSEFEVKKIRARSEAGIIRSFLEGNYASPRSPYGYDKINKKLVINKQEAEVVRLIHRLYIDNDLSVLSIVKYLNTTLKTKKVFTENLVRKIIKNEVYADKVVRRDLDMVFTDVAPIIINPLEKEKALLKMKSNSRGTLKSNKHIFRGTIVCDECKTICINDTTTKANGIKYKYYLCKTCIKRINEDTINELLNPVLTINMLMQTNKQKANRLKKEIRELRRHQVALRNLYNQKLISNKAYRIETKQLSNKIKNTIKSATRKEFDIMPWSDFSYKKKKDYIYRTINKININLDEKKIKKISYIHCQRLDDVLL